MIRLFARNGGAASTSPALQRLQLEQLEGRLLLSGPGPAGGDAPDGQDELIKDDLQGMPGGVPPSGKDDPSDSPLGAPWSFQWNVGAATVTAYDLIGGTDISQDNIQIIEGGNNSISAIIFEGQQAMEGLAITVTGASSVGKIIDARSGAAGDLSFFAADCPIGLIKLKSSVVGYDLNGGSMGGLNFAADVDGDGATDDLTAVYSTGGVSKIIGLGDIGGDVVLGGDLDVLQTVGGDIDGDVRLTASDIGKILAIARYDRGTGLWEGGNVAGDVVASGSIRYVLAKYGSISGDIYAGTEFGVAKAIGGDVSGEIVSGGDVLVVLAVAQRGQGGAISGLVDAIGDVRVIKAVGGDISADTVIDGDLRVAVAVARGGGGGITGSIDVLGDIVALKAVGGNLSADVACGGDLRVAMAVAKGGGGNISGELNVNGDIVVVKAVGGNISDAVIAGGDVNVIIAIGRSGSGGNISGGVTVGKDCRVIKAVNGTVGLPPVTIGGDLGVMVIVNGDLFAQLSVTGAAAGSSGDIRAVKVVGGNIHGSVAAAGSIGTLASIWRSQGGNFVGSIVSAEDGISRLHACGNITGSQFNVGGGLRVVTVVGNLTGSQFDIDASGNDPGSLRVLMVKGSVTASNIAVEDDLSVVKVLTDLYNSSIQADEFGKILVYGQIYEDALDLDTDEIVAQRGRFYAMDSTWRGWIDDGTDYGDHWFDEGQPNGFRAWVA